LSAYSILRFLDDEFIPMSSCLNDATQIGQQLSGNVFLEEKLES